MGGVGVGDDTMNVAVVLVSVRARCVSEGGGGIEWVGTGSADDDTMMM